MRLAPTKRESPLRRFVALLAPYRRILLEVTSSVDEGFARINESWNERVEAYVRGIDPADWSRVVDVLADLRELARSEADTLRAQAPDTSDRAARRAASSSQPDEMPPSWS